LMMKDAFIGLFISSWTGLISWSDPAWHLSAKWSDSQNSNLSKLPGGSDRRYTTPFDDNNANCVKSSWFGSSLEGQRQKKSKSSIKEKFVEIIEVGKLAVRVNLRDYDKKSSSECHFFCIREKRFEKDLLCSNQSQVRTVQKLAVMCKMRSDDTKLIKNSNLQQNFAWRRNLNSTFFILRSFCLDLE
jgi:hypothetical protein